MGADGEGAGDQPPSGGSQVAEQRLQAHANADGRQTQVVLPYE